MATRIYSSAKVKKSVEIETLSGSELIDRKIDKDAEYLVIKLDSNIAGNTEYGKALYVAVNAAVATVNSIAICDDHYPTLCFVSSKTDDISPVLKTSKRVKQKKVEPEIDPKKELSNKIKEDNSVRKLSSEHKQDRDARFLARRKALKELILSDSIWLTSMAISDGYGFKSSNKSAGPNRWKNCNKIFAITVDGKDYFPQYALNEDFKPLDIVKKIITLFGDKKTSWGLAVWFGSNNSWLGNKKPKEVLKTMPEQVLIAAKGELEKGVHG
ncbi:integrase [Photorhabdus cinerea]|uniref:integrase n=1 Tax=Photorhabdus cinerea TaxID=471575 RepID=UPI00140BD89F|nr:integrase [Photorhabdus cinerea]